MQRPAIPGDSKGRNYRRHELAVLRNMKVPAINLAGGLPRSFGIPRVPVTPPPPEPPSYGWTPLTLARTVWFMARLRGVQKRAFSFLGQWPDAATRDQQIHPLDIPTPADTFWAESRQ